VKENQLRGVYIEGLSEHRAATIEEAYVFLLYGLHRRKMFATVKNQESSRSHTIFQVKIGYQKGQELKIVNKFSLVDLAGSERLNDKEKAAERIEEAKYINKSLSALGNVIAALKHREGSKRKIHIPYRDSRLTHILKDCLGGNSLTHIIITLSPAACSLQETISSMKFANNAKSVKQNLKENLTLVDKSVSRSLKRRSKLKRPYNNLRLEAFGEASSASEEEDLEDSKSGDLSRQDTNSLSNTSPIFYSKEEIKHERHHRKHQLSVSSDDLVEIERYFKQVESLKNLKSEMAESRKRLKDIQTSKNLKKLFPVLLSRLRKDRFCQ
jgi:hypothetical protein